MDFGENNQIDIRDSTARLLLGFFFLSSEDTKSHAVHPPAAGGRRAVQRGRAHRQLERGPVAG